MTDNTSASIKSDSKPNLSPIGSTGLLQFSGYVHFEEPLRELQGDKWMRVVREMIVQDAVVGGMLFALKMMIRRVEWDTTPDGDSVDDSDAALFIDQCLGDMEQTWSDTVSEILSFLPFGFALFEIVYKDRDGNSKSEVKTNEKGDTTVSSVSKYDDGKLGWRGWQPRAQETRFKWEFTSDGQCIGMYQLSPPMYVQTYIPLDKCMLFRTDSRKMNPEGYALDPQTPIPTPDGWRILDDLQPGDKVFDEQGRIRYVTARADWDNRPCYRVCFSDGYEIISDENHRWLTQDSGERHRYKSGKVRSTKEIAGKLKAYNGTANHSIEWAGSLDYPEQILPIDPYFLGLWLGDGTSLTASISCEVHDTEETIQLIESCGYKAKMNELFRTTLGNGRKIDVYGSEKWSADNPQRLLRTVGVLGNKHIPQVYLRGSVQQRLSLLAGLMDSDGTVDTVGRCQFSNTNPLLASGVVELVRSLGIGAYMRSYTNNNGNLAWLVSFTPDFVPFRLSRKIDRCKPTRARKNHYISDCQPVEPRRTVCIETDAPSHLFLAGEGMVPTHNSILRNCYESWYMARNIRRIEGIGIERDLAGLPVMNIPGHLIQPDDAGMESDAFKACKKLIINIRRDNQEGVILPSDRDVNGNLLYDIKLMSTGGSRQFDTDKIITRYETRMAMSLLADFLFLGHQKTGSHALSADKTDMFILAISAWLDYIADTINSQAIPQILQLNDIKGSCKLTHGKISAIDLATLGTYLASMVQAGVNVAYPEAQEYLRSAADFPEPSEMTVGEEDQSSGLEMGKPPGQVQLPTGGTVTPGKPVKSIPVGNAGKPKPLVPPAPPMPAPKIATEPNGNH